MNSRALAWMEFAFNISYFAVLLATVAAMLLRLPRQGASKRPAAVRLVAAFVLLGTGDLGHVGTRILVQVGGERFAPWVGWGGLTTAVTVTLFYVLLLDAWRVHLSRRYGALEYTLLAAAAVRLVLLFLPGNRWADAVPPVGMSLARNAPLVVLGLGVMALYFREGRARERAFVTMAWLIAASFACYAPVILLVQRWPAIGLLMIPKTVAYLAMGVVAYRGFFRVARERRSDERHDWPGAPRPHAA